MTIDYAYIPPRKCSTFSLKEKEKGTYKSKITLAQLVKLLVKKRTTYMAGIPQLTLFVSQLVSRCKSNFLGEHKP